LQFKDYYQALGLQRDATADEVKKAYRKLARKHHPDLNKAPQAEARMKEINEAYAVLSDPGKRAAYDALGRDHRPGEEFRPPPGWDANFEFSGGGFGEPDAAGFSDFFAELFGRMGGGRPDAGFGRRGPRFESRGEDHHARILLDIEDAWRGARRQISLRVPRLDEAGRVVLDTRTLDVQIPKGVRAGQLIRLAAQGSPGPGGTAPGDLLLEVEFRPHPRYAASGRDLLVDLPVAPWEAALGSVVPVPLPDGSTLRVRIPAGAQSGRQLVVRGRGIPGNPPGDLELTVRVVLPPADTPRARELYEQMARELGFDPRAGSGA
jgi:curved DNA-binding protein